MNVVEDGWKKARSGNFASSSAVTYLGLAQHIFNYWRCPPAVNSRKGNRDILSYTTIGISTPNIPPWQCGFPIAGLLPQLCSSAEPHWPVAMRPAAPSQRPQPARSWCLQKHPTCDTPRENQRVPGACVRLSSTRQTSMQQRQMTCIDTAPGSWAACPNTSSSFLCGRTSWSSTYPRLVSFLYSLSSNVRSSFVMQRTRVLTLCRQHLCRIHAGI